MFSRVMSGRDRTVVEYRIQTVPEGLILKMKITSYNDRNIQGFENNALLIDKLVQYIEIHLI